MIMNHRKCSIPLLFILLLACGPPPEEAPANDDEVCEYRPDPEETRVDGNGEICTLYDHRGPFEVGVVDLEIDDLELAVFYPAVDASCTQDRFVYDLRQWLPEDDRDLISDDDAPLFEVDAAVDAEAVQGTFPLVLFSHGMAGYRFQSSTLLSHLASWGFVVASAEHPERNMTHVLESFAPDGDNAPEVMRQIVDFFADAVDDEASPFFELVDLTQIAATGHSMGGNGAVSMVGEPGVEAAIFYASQPEVSDEELADHGVELMWQAGTFDGIIQVSSIESAYENSHDPKTYLGIGEAGHLAFSDICAVGADRGGILQIAADSGMDIPSFLINLARDGCRDSDLHYEDAWPIIHHYSVAHLRAAFAIDDEPVGLDEATIECYAEATDLDLRQY